MCKILTLKERESLAKLTKLVEGLTNKKVVLESRKDCNCCGDKKHLKENAHNFKDSDFIKPNLNKRYSVYELMHGQPTRFWNEIQNNFTYEVKNATLYTKEEAEILANKLLQPRMEKYQKDGKHYSELHIGDLFKKGMLKEEAYTTKTIAALKSYMGNKGEKVYITPPKPIEGTRFPEFRLINAANYWMVNMTFSSPEEAKKYAKKKELIVVPKPKEVFKETLDQSYSDMEDLAEAIVNELGSHLPVHEEAKIRNIILSNISTDKTSNEGKIRDVVKVLGGKGETKLRELFKYYNANLTEGLMSGASEGAKQSDIDASDREYIEIKQKRNKLAQEKYNKGYRELNGNQKNIVNRELRESISAVKDNFLHLYKLTYPDGKIRVVNYDGEYMSPNEALKKMNIYTNGLKSYKYNGVASTSEKYKKWYENKGQGLSNEEAYKNVFGLENLNESTISRLDLQKSYNLNNLQIEKVRENAYTVKLDNKTIGSIRLNQNIINLDNNKAGKTRTELYYTLSWDRDVCKNIFGVEFHNGSKKEEGKVNAVNYSVGKTTYKENPFTIKKIKKYLEQELERLKSKTMKESKQEERFIGYEIKCIDSEGELRALLEYIKSNGNTGHSFGIVVDEGEDKKDFFWDGDGADRIESITPIKEKKKNLKEGVWALPKDALARRKAMNFKQELQRIKTDIYNIAGSDDLYNALDNAIESLDQLIIAGKSQSNI